MGNIGSHTGHISNASANVGLVENLNSNLVAGPWVARPASRPVKAHSQHKVLPDRDSRQKLRHTNNGDILQSGGTLSGRHQSPIRSGVQYREPRQPLNNRSYLSAQRYSFHKTGLTTSPSMQTKQNVASHKTLKEVRVFKSEPDLRFPVLGNRQEMREKKSKKKYKAPAPPTSRVPGKASTDWEENSSDECPIRRVRLFKTRAETKKETSHVNKWEQVMEKCNDIPDIKEEKIQADTSGKVRPSRLPLLEVNIADSSEFQKELKEATKRLRAAKTQAQERTCNKDPNDCTASKEHLEQQITEVEESCLRGEPSGKESSTAEMSPVLGVMSSAQKPRAFYFGMEQAADSDVSSNGPDEDENAEIALSLRPVLPRKPAEIPRFSPAAAWRLLDTRSHDSGISGDARPPPCASWTPQQDLGDDSSLEEACQEAPRPTRPRPHVFSLSLPRDHQLASYAAPAITKNGLGVSSLRRLKRSVSGVLSTLSSRKDGLRNTYNREDDDDNNWFFSRSAPNSLNDHSVDVLENAFPHNNSSTSRVMYLPEIYPEAPVGNGKEMLSIFTKSCEELRVPESLRDPMNISNTPWSLENKPKKAKKFTFQSTVRQIERRRIAEKLSKEAEKKEKQRLRELEAMRRVEEEFQRKRAKEKANIRQQLRLYCLDETQWSSLPTCNLNVKTEERQEPDGAISSSTSSSPPPPKSQELFKKSVSKDIQITAQVTQELSEYRQIQREYKEYRGHTKYSAENSHPKQTTVHPEVTCNMPRATGSNLGNGNYRKDFAYGIKSASVCSNLSEGSQNNSPKMYHSRHAPITRF